MKIIYWFLPMLISMGIGDVFAQTIILTNITKQAATCNENGSASVNPAGGTAPYSVSWHEGENGPMIGSGISITGLAPKLYAVKITDALNVSKIDTFSIKPTITGFANGGIATCPLSNGTATAFSFDGLAPYTYLWSNGETTAMIQNLPGNTYYSVSAKDANNCTVYYEDYNSQTWKTSYQVNIGETSNISALFTSDPELCPFNNGTLTASPINGLAPYTFVWETTPVQSGNKAINLAKGSHAVNITDAHGCKARISGVVLSAAGSLTVNAAITAETCSQANGTINLSITNGAQPYTVLWNDGNTNPSRTGLSNGYYGVQVTDQNNCIITKSMFVQKSSPLLTTKLVTTADCNNGNGTIQVNVSGGQEPYMYQWYHGPTTSNISNLKKGLYVVKINDANGCEGQTGAWIGPDASCYGKIQGKVFQDHNGNCIQDVGDLPILNRRLYLKAMNSPNNTYQNSAVTNANGDYSLSYLFADDYTLSYSSDVNRTTACPANGQHEMSIPTGGVNYTNKDFALMPLSLFEDVSLNNIIVSSPPRPGFTYGYYIPVENIGTKLSNGYVEVEYSEFDTFVSSIPAADYFDPATRKIRFNYSNLPLGGKTAIYVSFTIPPTVLINTQFYHNLNAVLTTADPTLANNTLSHNFLVVGSYDPNDIQVNPEGALQENEIDLNYTIRFQNTGTYMAEQVIVEDVLDINLDLESISDVESSHPFRIQYGEDRLISFIFENINLPDSNSNEAGSHGYIRYKIKRKTDVMPGTTIPNKVNIFFDYNEPIETNTVVNWIASTSSINRATERNAGLVYPNPSKGDLNFSFENPIVKIQVLASTGVLLEEFEVDNKINFELQLLNYHGLLFYKAYTKDEQVYIGKLVLD